MSASSHIEMQLKPRKGRGKVVLGFLIYQLGLTMLIDTNFFEFAIGMVVFGVLFHVFGLIQNFFVGRLERSKQQLKTSSNKKQVISAALVVLGLVSFSSSYSSQAALPPMDQIKDIDQRLKSFHKGDPLTPVQEKENQKIKDYVLRKDFDLREMCRLALGKHWKPLTPKQRALH